MNDEAKHGKKNTSTSLLFEILKNEETLPDHLLSNDSQIKKKRDSKKFFEEISYMAAIQLIRLYQEMIFILKTRAKEKYINAPRPVYDENDLRVKATMPVRKMFGNDYQHLQHSKEKYLQLMANLDKKIDTVKEMIHLQRQTVAHLQQQANVLRNELVQEWDALVGRFQADPDFEGMQIAFSDNKVVKINKRAYLFVMEQINNALKKGEVPTYKLFDLINAKATALIEEQMAKDLAHLAPEVRQQMLKENKQRAIDELNQRIWLDICTTPSLVTKLEEMYKMEHAIVEAQTKLAMCEKTLDALLNIKQKAEDQLNAIDELLNQTEMPAEQILDLDSAAERFEQQASDLDKLLYSDLNNIDSLHEESASLFKEIKDLQAKAIEGIQTGALKKDDTLHDQMQGIKNQVEKVSSQSTSKVEKAVDESKEIEVTTPKPTL